MYVHSPSCTSANVEECVSIQTQETLHCSSNPPFTTIFFNRPKPLIALQDRVRPIQLRMEPMRVIRRAKRGPKERRIERVLQYSVSGNHSIASITYRIEKENEGKIEEGFQLNLLRTSKKYQLQSRSKNFLTWTYRYLVSPPGLVLPMSVVTSTELCTYIYIFSVRLSMDVHVLCTLTPSSSRNVTPHPPGLCKAEARIEGTERFLQWWPNHFA